MCIYIYIYIEQRIGSTLPKSKSIVLCRHHRKFVPGFVFNSTGSGSSLCLLVSGVAVWACFQSGLMLEFNSIYCILYPIVSGLVLVFNSI